LTPANLLRFLYFAYLLKPKSERQVYRFIGRHKVKRIVEVGLQTGQRALRLIAAAQRYSGQDAVSYTGIDLFEARASGLRLKEAHRMLCATGARVRLIPGDPLAGLSRSANTLPGTDLVLIAGDHEPELLARAWYYLPRMLRAGSRVYEQAPAAGHGPLEFRVVPPEELLRRASTPRPARPQAA